MAFKMYRAPIHGNPNKLASVSFWNGPEYKRLRGMKFKDRATGLRWVKSMYPRAKDISIIFYVPAKETVE